MTAAQAGEKVRAILEDYIVTGKNTHELFSL